MFVSSYNETLMAVFIYTVRLIRRSNVYSQSFVMIVGEGGWIDICEEILYRVSCIIRDDRTLMPDETVEPIDGAKISNHQKLVQRRQ